MISCCFICGSINVNGKCPDRDCKRGCAGKYIKTKKDKLKDLNAKYDPILQDILDQIPVAIGKDGATEDSKVLALQQEYNQEIQNKEAERLLIING